MPERNYLLEVEDALRKKREAAEAQVELRRLEVHAAIPEVALLDAELATTASKVLSVMIAGTDVADKVADIRKKNEELRKKREALLVKGGFAPDYTAVRYDCEKCADSGYVGIDMCSCMKSCIAELRLADSDLGRLASFQSFENFDLSYYAPGEERECVMRSYKILKAFAESFSKDSVQNFLLLGDTGLGKTHLSTAVGVSVIKRGFDVLYRTVQSVMDDCEEVQFKGGRSDSVRQYYDCDLLIIDDLGAEMSTQFTVSSVYNIINARMNRKKPTIISTNLSQKELRDRYADRITSRLFGEYIPLQFRGTDIRKQRLRGAKK